MKVYLASRYGRREELCGYREELQAKGIEVTSRWLNGDHQLAHDGKPLGPEREALIESNIAESIELKRHFAAEDISDLEDADIAVFFTEAADVKGCGRGGRHVELGFVLGWNSRLNIVNTKGIIVVGPRENVFYCLDSIVCVNTWEEARRHLYIVVHREALAKGTLQRDSPHACPDGCGAYILQNLEDIHGTGHRYHLAHHGKR